MRHNGRGHGRADGWICRSGNGHGFGASEGYGWGDGDGNGEGDGAGFTDGDGLGYGFRCGGLIGGGGIPGREVEIAQ